ncbi:MAG: S8 family serine peptidase, partial [Phycisphaerae bacterium]|nr:S8 family serine peptidase [Saprospiraceae bacterium]
GVSVLVRDDGQLGPHIDLQGRLSNYSLEPPTNGTHGDGVVGILGGAGNLDPTKKGMATGTDLYAIDYINDFQDLTLPLHLTQGVTITNSSYSDGCNDGYTLSAQTVDQQIFEHPTLMHVFSGGNSNPLNCEYGAGGQWGNITGGHKMAKNVIAVANVYADATLAESSSRGPAYDGRLKPDITANGQGQGSLDPNNGYQTFGGTSAASPGIAGCLAQLTHAFRTINAVNDAPSPLLKATILNTANELGNLGPDFKFGWGLVNTWRALQLLEQHQWLEGNADQNGSIEHTIQIPAGVKEAKIMLYWAEPPAAENSAKALINDLDLTVADGNGTVSLPWKLDPTPNPTILDTPAGKGRDSLNNVEQVLIESPGTYTIRVNGTEVPLGPQHYYILWEFVKDEIKVTYPAGGEGLVPDEVERIQWDAYGNTGIFTLRYTTDGGATFSTIANVGGDQRMYDWTVPNTVSGKVYVSVSRDTKSDTSDFPSSIVRVPQNLQVTNVCPYSISLSWTELNDTLSYDAYLLGSKYMELKGTTNSNFITMPIQNGEEDHWLSVRASHPNGTAGRRANAIYRPGGIYNCSVSHDLAVRKLLSPVDDIIVSCGPSLVTISIRVKNEGQNLTSGGTAFYQLGNNPPVGEALPDIPVGGALDFSFQTLLTLDLNGNVLLKTWVVLSNDGATYNDTLSHTYTVVSEGVNQFFTENFEATPALPIGWRFENPDGLIGWQTTDSLFFPVVGPDDLIGRSIHVNFFQYGPAGFGNEDYLYMIPVDLAGFDSPALSFKVAHARFDDTYSDGMRVEVFSDCDLGATPVTVWQKNDPDLMTVPDSANYYYPGSGADWRGESADLTPFIGKKIIIRFVSINGYGNSLYLDDIGITGFEPVQAEFVAPDSVCRLDTVVFQATPSTSDAAYAWSFGTAAIPGLATGIGPHNVTYPIPGDKTVRLIVSNSLDTDTMTQAVTVLSPATANFTAVQNGFTVSFTNTSSNANTYLWDFGDGVTSTETNPTHTYAGQDFYVVNLFATNICRTHLKSLTLGLTQVNNLLESIGIRILPNPTSGDFTAELDSHIAGNVQLSLFDAAGRKLAAQETRVKHGITRVAFENLHLPKGLYQLNVQTDGKQATFSVVVQ